MDSSIETVKLCCCLYGNERYQCFRFDSRHTGIPPVVGRHQVAATIYRLERSYTSVAAASHAEFMRNDNGSVGMSSLSLGEC